MSSLGTPKIGKTDSIEEKGVLLMKSLLPERIENNFFGGKMPGIDGELSIRDYDGCATGCHYKYQLKSTTKKNLSKYSLKKEVLNLCILDKVPILLILANLERQIVSWEYIDINYISSRLGLNLDQKTYTIKFDDKKIITKDNNFIQALIPIYNDHEHIPYVDGMTAEELAEKIRTWGKTKEKESIEDQLSTTLPDNKSDVSLARDIKDYFRRLERKCFLFLLTIYLSEPYYTTDKPGIISKLDITKDEEEVFTKELAEQKIITCHEFNNSITIANRDKVISAINETANGDEFNFVLENL